MKVHLNSGTWSEEFKGKRFVIASGARSFIPPIPGLADTGYITTETFFGDKFPKKPWSSLIIIGGGVIAAEFAHIFSAFGTKISIIEMLPRLVSTEEPEISAFLEQEFRKHMDVYTNFKAIGFRREKEMKVAIIEEFGSGKKKEVKAEEILVAVGRSSNADRLKVDKCGIQVDKKGWIQISQYLETNKKNIWAIGDANGQYQFRHKANYDAEICVRNMFAPENVRFPIDYSAVPWAIFTYPQIGHVGMTQQEAIASGHEIYVAVKPYSSVAKGFAMGYDSKEEGGFAKLIVDKSHRILGAHVVGPEAAILVQQFVYLMNAGYNCAPPEEIISQIPKIQRACPDAGSFMPIYKSMVIHPSLNEVTGWIIGGLRPVNIKSSLESHTHEHEHEHAHDDKK
jgi:mycothione reductase